MVSVVGEKKRVINKEAELARGGPLCDQGEAVDSILTMENTKWWEELDWMDWEREVQRV